MDNMKYELAKQLKDAGYPQNGCDCNWVYSHDKDCDPMDIEIYDPPLGELIDSLGTKEFYLAREQEEGEWICRYDDTDDCMIDCCGSEGKGNTPEEAVANLWLEIKNNK